MAVKVEAGMPRTLKIGPLRYTIKTPTSISRKAEELSYMESFQHEGDVVHLRGIHIPDELIIEVRAPAPASMLRAVLTHEVLHALLDQSQLDSMFDNGEVEEKFVKRLTPWLLSALQDNPRLIEFLTDRRQGGAGSATWWRNHA